MNQRCQVLLPAALRCSTHKSMHEVHELQANKQVSPAVVAPEWLACFPASDRAALFDAFFEQAPSAVLLQALVSCAPLRGCCSYPSESLLQASSTSRSCRYLAEPEVHKALHIAPHPQQHCCDAAEHVQAHSAYMGSHGARAPRRHLSTVQEVPGARPRSGAALVTAVAADVAAAHLAARFAGPASTGVLVRPSYPLLARRLPRVPFLVAGRYQWLGSWHPCHADVCCCRACGRVCQHAVHALSRALHVHVPVLVA